MIKLKDILNERSAYLPKEVRMSDIVFHGRNSTGAKNILDTLKIRTNTHIAQYGGQKIYGVSTSRTFDGANKFGHIVFILSKSKIKNKYKLKPFDYFHFNNWADDDDKGKRKWDPTRTKSKNEFEDVIVTAVIDDAFRKLVATEKIYGTEVNMSQGDVNFKKGAYNVDIKSILQGIQFGLPNHKLRNMTLYAPIIKLGIKKGIRLWDSLGEDVTEYANN